jgi:hypothetical protein
MSNSIESVSVKLFHSLAKEGNWESQDPREAFWGPVKRLRSGDQSPLLEISTRTLENLLTKNFGRSLKRHLVDDIDSNLSALDYHLFGRRYEDILDELKMHGGGAQVYMDVESYVRLAELRKSTIKDNPEYQALLNKRMAATSISFTAKINSYSSIELALLVTPIGKAIEFFDHNFDYFQSFLRNFAAETFAESISHIGNTHYFGIEAEINKVIESEVISTEATRMLFAPTVAESKQPEVIPRKENILPKTIVHTVDKAEWAWKVANTSLIVPVFLALLVLYFGLQQLSNLRDGQDKLLQQHLDAIKANTEYVKTLQLSSAGGPKPNEKNNDTKSKD